jgi:Cu(I)/Ag(I) efflux system membrane fusion protein
MASSGAGANWLQTGESIENPYFGQQMLTCGEALHVIDAGQYLSTPPVVETSAPAGGHQH